MRALDDDLWDVERPFEIGMGQDIGIRMTVVRLADGGLWLHSPIPFDRLLREALSRVGPVCAIVAPSKMHQLFVAPYLSEYRNIPLFGAPGLDEKREDLRVDEILDDEAPPLWKGQIEQHVFRGAEALNETVFFHPASKTLILTDLAFNVPKRDRGRARLFHFVSGALGRFGPHRFIRAMIRDKKAARESVERILGWNFERVVVSHGEVLEEGGHERFRDAFGYLL